MFDVDGLGELAKEDMVIRIHKDPSMNLTVSNNRRHGSHGLHLRVVESEDHRNLLESASFRGYSIL